MQKTLQHDIAGHLQDKEYLAEALTFKDKDLTMLTSQVRKEKERNEDLQLQIKSQEVEIRTLLNCVENLRK